MADIPLAEMLAELREQLLQAQGEGADKDIKFRIEEAELDIQMAVSKEGGNWGWCQVLGLRCKGQC